MLHNMDHISRTDDLLPPVSSLTLERTSEILRDLYGQPVSAATILVASRRVAHSLEPVVQAIRDTLITTVAPVHLDEMGHAWRASYSGSMWRVHPT